MDIPAIVSRALHIVSVTLLVGAAMYGSATRSAISSSYRSRIYLGLAVLVATGIVNLLMRGTPLPQGYHMWFGIKMLFALHILAVYLLIALGRGDEAKQRRWLHGIAGSGIITIFLGTVIAHMA